MSGDDEPMCSTRTSVHRRSVDRPLAQDGHAEIDLRAVDVRAEREVEPDELVRHDRNSLRWANASGDARDGRRLLAVTNGHCIGSRIEPPVVRMGAVRYPHSAATLTWPIAGA